mmetsp:Transcript_94421/g.294102  ORF Transcript_94421/g.294102 Transcript_94421/m.294102 type:complete len:239 (+) Transcript_94421:290-1006(+)
MEPLSTTTMTPMIRTSNMQSLLNVRDTDTIFEGSSPRADWCWPCRADSPATWPNTSMSRKVNRSTKTASMTKPMMSFTSPARVQRTSATMHFQMPTSALAFSGKRSSSTTKDSRPRGMVPFSTSALTSRRSAMQGKNRPRPKRTIQATRSAMASPRAPFVPTRLITNGVSCSLSTALASCSLSPSSSNAGGGGSDIPREDTVEPTQNRAKHVNPMSSRIIPDSVGGWFRLRTRKTMRM